jgi:adenylate cyclase
MAGDTHPAAPPRLSAADLALRMGVDRAWVDRLARAGVIDAAADGSFDPGDIHRVRLLKAFEDAGVPLETLIAASDAGRISLRYYDELHPTPSPASARSFAEFAASLGEGRRHLGQLFAAFGIAEPDGAVVLSVEDEAVIAEILDIVVATGQPDLALRAVRMFGEGARRAADAALGIYGEAVIRTGEDLSGLPVDDAFERVLRPWARFARQSIPLAGWLSGRHLSRAIDEYSITESERILYETGFVVERVDAPPAVAFVDLTGFTRLTEERGDDVAAAMAMRLGDVSTDIAQRRGGRVVKLLGDGVLLRFDDRWPAVLATQDLLSALPANELPTGHAGIASGPLIARDGDVFGRTVNLAARIADAAPDGRLWVTRDVLLAIPSEATDVTQVEATLQGIGRVTLYEVAKRILD